MRVCLYLDPARTFRWHGWVADSLRHAGHTVHVRYSTMRRALPSAYRALLAMESIAYKLDKNKTAIESILLAETEGEEPFDAVIHFTIDQNAPAGKRSLTPCFNYMPTEFGAIAALVSGDLRIDIFDSHLILPVTAHPALDDADVLLRSLDNVLSVAAGLILKALETKRNPLVRGAVGIDTPRTVLPEAYAHFANRLLNKAGRYLQILAHGHRDWSIAWRVTEDSLLDQGTATFQVLPKQKGHYYADPFPFRDFIFFEDYDYATGYGHIAVTKIDGEQASTPRPVLDTGYHLSYPFVFAHDGEIWMIPESGDMHETKLYRAVDFPDQWECVSTLLSGVMGYDATLLLPQDDDPRFRMFVSERLWHSTGWDTVSLFDSTNLISGWTRHAGNPLLFDARYSRSGGRIFQHNGQLIRPVQDCSHMYGGATNLCRIDKLNDQEYRQTMIGTIYCAPKRGCHTYNYQDGIEVIDFFDRGYNKEVVAHYRQVEQVQAVSAPPSEPLPAPAPLPA